MRKRQMKNTANSGGAREPRRRKTIRLPEQFDLHNNYEQVMRKMNEFRAETDKPADSIRPVSLNFNDIKHIDISSALVLAADIDVWRLKMGKLRSHHDEWHPEIRTLLNEMGLFELLSMPRLKKESPQWAKTSFVKFLSAQKADGQKAKMLRERIEETMSTALSGEQRRSLFTSLAEALANAKQHAYANPNALKHYEKWWITAAYSRENGRELTVALYDRGQTIPATMLKAKRWESIREWLPVDSDSRLIETAMRESVRQSAEKGGKTRSSTGELHRGKGMKQLLDFAALEKSGKVHIISRKGHCCFSFIGGKLKVEIRRDVGVPMRGTLVEWRINV